MFADNLNLLWAVLSDVVLQMRFAPDNYTTDWKSRNLHQNSTWSGRWPIILWQCNYMTTTITGIPDMTVSIYSFSVWDLQLYIKLWNNPLGEAINMYMSRLSDVDAIDLYANMQINSNIYVHQFFGLVATVSTYICFHDYKNCQRLDG